MRLREALLRAVQAMHAILTNMVLFSCNDCKERFPAFHPAYMPPAAIAKEMEVLRPQRDGLAACSTEVAKWDEFPPCGEGIEKPENVTARMRMPWHPKEVPLLIMLRRNVGRGKDALEGLHVRWHYLANLLQALLFLPQRLSLAFRWWRDGTHAVVSGKEAPS